MNKQDDGGPAFPRPSSTSSNASEGMTLRDWFAGQAMQGILTGITNITDDESDIIVNRPQDVSELSYLYADALLAQRNKS